MLACASVNWREKEHSWSFEAIQFDYKLAENIAETELEILTVEFESLNSIIESIHFPVDRIRVRNKRTSKYMSSFSSRGLSSQGICALPFKRQYSVNSSKSPTAFCTLAGTPKDKTGFLQGEKHI